MTKITKTIILLSLTAVMLGGCTSRKVTRGYMADEKVVSAIRPQVDTQESVQEMLGSPSSKALFDNENWYYFSKKTSQLAFFREDITAMDIIAVRFDGDGYVTAVNRYSLDDHKNIDPVGDKTHTHGRELSFIQELFGNIGRVGTGGPSNVQPGN